MLVHILMILFQNYVYFGNKDEPVISIHDKSNMNSISSYRLWGSGGITDMAMYASDVQPPATSTSVTLWNVYLPNAAASRTPFSQYLTCNCDDLELGQFKSSRHRFHSANRMPIGGFLSDLHCIQHCISHRIRDIWCESDLYLGQFKIIQGQRSRCQSRAHRWFPIRLPLTLSSYLAPFKVIQGQRSWRQSKAHWWFPI